MCGRAAQTAAAVSAAAQSLHVDEHTSNLDGNASHSASSSNTRHTENKETSSSAADDNHDNYNLSPGMDATIFWKESTTEQIQSGRKRWGLVTRPGSKANPLPENSMNLHFSNLMFNARTDTLFDKPTFARLTAQRKSCLVAVDGFFEWKEEAVAGTKSKKQPYFVYRKEAADANKDMQRTYLLFPGLWTSVPTGRAEASDSPSTLDTFTILTTDVCQPLKWLHTRMPVCIWDEALALKWLQAPTKAVLKQLEQGAQQTPQGFLQWHAVSPEMSSLKYRSPNSIQAKTLPTKISSFFQTKAAETTRSDVKPINSDEADTNAEKKGTTRQLAGSSVALSSTFTPSKRLKSESKGASVTAERKVDDKTVTKGPLDSFFTRKSK